MTLQEKPKTEFDGWVHALALLAVAVRLFFWHYTNRTWEDALITLQHAENAARGLGLTHDPGLGRVHGFTSPISVLVPLVAELLHRGSGLMVQKAASAIAGGVCVYIGARIVRRLELPSYMALLVCGYLAFEHQQILFGMAGMESQLVVMILLFSIYTLFDLRPILVGVGLGLCMLARPDFLFWVAIVLALLTWKCWRLRSFRPLAIVMGCLAAIYGPWVAFTTWYYGSPIPNTILAKEFGYPNRWFADMSPFAIVIKTVSRVFHLVFGGLGPAFAGNGTGFESLGDHYLICLAMLLFLLPCVASVIRSRDLPRVAIVFFVITYALYYLFLMNFVFGWYTVPLAAVTILAIAIGLEGVLKRIFHGRVQKRAGYAVVIAYLAIIVAVLPIAFRGDRHVQEYVEDGLREPIGLYLGAVMGPSQTVGAESLGYFGYYSRREVIDYPGLSNPAAVRFLRDHPDKRTLIDELNHFRPDYLVLRPIEYAKGLSEGNLWLQNDYQVLFDDSVPPNDIQLMLHPKSSLDTEFLVLRRK